MPQAVTATAKELEEPSYSEIQRVIVETRVGGDLVVSIRSLAVRTSSTDMNWVADAIEINMAVGGDLVEVLESVSKTIRSRVQLAAQVDALTAEGKMSAGILMALPPGLVVLILIMNPEYFKGIWSSSLAYILAGICAFLLVGGGMWLRKMVNAVSLK